MKSAKVSVKKSKDNISFFENWWQSIDHTTFFMVLILMALGVFASFSGSAAVAHKYKVDTLYFTVKHLTFTLLGAFVLVSCTFFNLKQLKMLSILMFLVAAFLLPVPLFLAHADIKGANRWIPIPFLGIKLQPSEFFKVSFALFTGVLLSASTVKGRFKGLIVSVFAMGFGAIALLAEPDFGMFLLVSSTWAMQIFVSGISYAVIMPMLFSAFGIVVLAYNLLPHVQERILKFFNPQAGDNYQVDQAREAILAGSIFGVGAGEGQVKTTIPDANNDFIFAVIAEEYGLIGCTILLAFISVIVYKIFIRILKNDSLFVQIASVGLLGMLTMQTLVNVGVVLQVLPTTGMAFPFFSYGGSSIIASSLAFGFLLALTKDNNIKK